VSAAGLTFGRGSIDASAIDDGIQRLAVVVADVQRREP
jgi:hypothetical protein